MPGHVFLCYAREDEEFALKLAAAVADRGVELWVDQWNISPSEDWDQAIDDALRDCQKLMMVLSPVSVTRQEVRSEFKVALNLGKPIIPILYRECDVPRQLLNTQHADFTKRPPDDPEALDEVIRAIEGRPSSRPSRPSGRSSAPSESRSRWVRALGASIVVAVILALSGLMFVLYRENFAQSLPPKRPAPESDSGELPDTPHSALVGDRPGLTATQLVAREAPASSSPYPDSGTWLVRYGLEGEDGRRAVCEVASRGRFSCQTSCGTNAGTLVVQSGKATQHYDTQCGKKRSSSLVYDVRFRDESTLHLERGRDWKIWTRDRH